MSASLPSDDPINPRPSTGRIVAQPAPAQQVEPGPFELETHVAAKEPVRTINPPEPENEATAAYLDQERAFQLEAVVRKLADWNREYPRGTVYSFNAKVDEQLIELEEEAKRLCPP